MEDCNSCRCLDGRRDCSKVRWGICSRVCLVSFVLLGFDVLVFLFWEFLFLVCKFGIYFGGLGSWFWG